MNTNTANKLSQQEIYRKLKDKQIFKKKKFKT